MKTPDEIKEKARERTKEIAAKFAEHGDAFGWFDALYSEADGNTENIPWADLEPNQYLKTWADTAGLKGDGRTALVVGCGLGDDAAFLDDLGFKVSAFDISPTAIEWAKKLYGEKDIRFEVMDLFEPADEWIGAFDLVLEVYTIQPLPLEMRSKVMDAIAGFANAKGELIIVSRLRENDEEPDEVPWPVSRKELKRFEENGFEQTAFAVMPGGEDDLPIDRFVAVYRKS
jgi:SAM-dependent methyltransferase